MAGGGMVSIDQKDVQKFNGGAALGASSGSPMDMIFDSSGWSVATGGSKSSASSEKAEGLSLPPWLLAVGAALLVVGWIRTAQR